MNNHLISLNNKDEIDHVDSYFECISECCIINGHKECVTRCIEIHLKGCLLYTSPSPRDSRKSRMPSSA